MSEKNQPKQSGPDSQASQHARAETTSGPQQSQAQGQSSQPQQAQEGQHQQLQHALQQHAQAKGWNLSGVDWAALVSALEQLFAAFNHGGQQPTAT
jgi:hypothetical protein